MEKTTRIGLVVNEAIGDGVAAGPGREGYEVAKGLLERGRLGKVFCLDIAGRSVLPDTKVERYCRSRLKRRLIGLVARAHRRYPAIRGRRRIEEWLDAYYASKLTRDACDVLYCPKPLYPRTIRRAKELGIRVVVETSVLHPRFNLDAVDKERRQLGISGAAGYTDDKRVRNIEEALRLSDGIFSWNSFVRSSYLQYGVPEAKFLKGLDYAPPGIDTRLFSPNPGQEADVFTVLHVSSISVIKGVHYLLQAWERIADEIDGRLIIVGPADRDMRHILTSRKVRNAEWVGRVRNPVDYYRSASVFVSPSISDAGPRTVLEAMACGTPAIVSDHCGVSEVIRHGVNGFVYRYDDVSALASHIKWAALHPEQLKAMRACAYETGRRHQMSDYSSEIEQRIEAVVSAVTRL